MDWVLLVISLLVILAGAELFTNGVEWVGEGFGLSEGAVGSVLAAVGTALPETLLPIIAIASGHAAGEDIGVGAILGAPFMLTTLAMVVVAVAVFIFARGGRRPLELDIDHARDPPGPRLLPRDVLAGRGGRAAAQQAVRLRPRDRAHGGLRLLRAPALPGRRRGGREESDEIRTLYVWDWLRKLRSSLPAWTKDGPTAAPFVQVALALGLIVLGAEIFVGSVGDIGKAAGIPTLAFSLLVAPLATELPEKFNSVLWVRRRKDTLAMGNMTGAMVFQSSFPVTVGLLFTPWELSHEALVAALVALLAGSVMYLTLRIRGGLSAPLLLIQGVFYVGYVGYVLTKL